MYLWKYTGDEMPESTHNFTTVYTEKKLEQV